MKDRMSLRTKNALIAVIIGIVVNLALALTKLFVGLRANSLCILLDSTNGFFDTLTGVVLAVAFGLTALAPTEKFPYGFGRSEYLAGFIVAVVAAVMGVVFFLDSLNRMAMPEPIWFGWQGCILIAVSVAVKLVLAIMFTLLNRKLQSKALKAVIVDSFLDVGITSATLLSFTLSAKISYAADAIFGIVISIVVIGVSVKMIVDSVKVLVGNNDLREEKDVLVRLCREERVIDEINAVRLHDYGYRAKYGTVSVTFAPSASAEERSDATERVKARLKEETGTTIEFIQ